MRFSLRLLVSARLQAAFVPLLCLLVVLGASFHLGHVQTVAAEAEYAGRATRPVALARISFAAAGDVIPHQAVRAAADAQKATDAAVNHDGWDNLFGEVSDIFRSVDYGFVNLETPVAPVHSHGTRPFLFNAPVALLDSLKANNVGVVSFANNHAMDQGWAGFGETVEQLAAHKILGAGAGANAETAWQPVIVEKNGVRVGFLGMTRWLNGGRNPEDVKAPHVAYFPYKSDAAASPGIDEAYVLEAVKRARQQCDLLVVSIHWGVEYAVAPRTDDVELAHKIMEAGASLILGHHPHVLQPVETYRTQDERNTVIVYSMGNFLSNQSRTYVDGLMPDRTGDPRDSLIVRFAAVKKDYGPGGTRVELGDFGILPAWTENNNLALQSGRDRSPLIRPVLMDREIPRLEARIDALEKSCAQATSPSEAGADGKASAGSAPLAAPCQLAGEQKREWLSLEKQLDTLQHRREVLLQRTGDDYLIAPPPAKAK